MKPLKFVVAAILAASASLAIAQTSPSADDGSAMQQSNQASRQLQECVGPTSYCSLYAGGS
ncbi:hypothetical protein [Caballeronia sp. Lep1P3]|uniref:hypothetical protein n=1 Tax=Caballeronia sp. Lep1P3 TaxID=2878150 RepID=UPI001FD091AC|nr:hypothetical protein [Caballeronia sp. Lep1P3]